MEERFNIILQPSLSPCSPCSPWFQPLLFQLKTGIQLCSANFLGQVGLDDVADFVIAEAFERKAALEA